MFIPNKYSKWYFDLMSKAQNQIITGYSERHHIIPKSLGGNNSDFNLILLTARQHFVAHQLLAKMTSGIAKQKMYKALWTINMSRAGNLRQVSIV